MGIIEEGLHNIVKLINRHRPIDPMDLKRKLESFNDEMTDKVSWSPISSGGIQFQTYTSNFGINGNLEFTPTRNYKAMPFLLFGASFFSAIMIYWVIFYRMADFEMIGDIFKYGFLLGPIIIFILGIISYIKVNTIIVFDKQSGYFYRLKGKIKTNKFGLLDEKSIKGTLLNNIYAIQIIPEYIHEKNNHFYSFEINLVLKDATRIMVIDNSELKIIRSDAATIGNYLGVPVWDITPLLESNYDK